MQIPHKRRSTLLPLSVVSFLLFCFLQSTAWGSLPETQKALDSSTKEIEELANTNPSGETKDDRKRAWDQIKDKINKKNNLLDLNLYEAWKNTPDVNKSLNFRNPFEKPKERWDERYKMIKEYLAKLNEWREKLSKAKSRATKEAINSISNEVLDWVEKVNPLDIPGKDFIDAMTYDAKDLHNKLKEMKSINDALKHLEEEIGRVNESAKEASDIFKDLNKLFDEFKKLIDRNINPDNKTYSDRYRAEEKAIFDNKGKTDGTKPASKDCAVLAEKEKSKLFGDLCWCSCSPSTGGGAKYEDGRGCVCSGVLGGEWTVPMITSGECFKNSTASVGASEDSCRKVITDMNRQWAEKLIQMAKDLIEDFFTPLPGLSQGKKGAKSASETQKERVERKLNEGDLDKAAGYTKAAAEMYPPLESTARAVIPGTLPWRLTKLALTFVPPLEFGTSRRLLESTSRLDEKNQQVKENLSKVIQWEKEWNQIKSLSEECFSDIKAKRVCECQRLFDGKIEPLNKSFNIPTGRAVEVTFERSPDEVRWGAPKLGTRSVMEQTPIPEKDALRGKLVLELDNARRGCRYQPGLAEPVGVLEAYISDRTRPGRTDQTIADMAKKMLERKGLCDCEHELAEKALEIADKWVAEQGPPLKVSLQAAKTVMKKGESVELSPVISGGRPPYNFSYTGYWAFDVVGGAISGQGQTTTLLRAKMVGAQTLDVNVTDSKGQKASGRIVLNVIEDTTSKPPGQTTIPSKLDVSLMAEKSVLKIGESAYITAAVTGGKPPYIIRWSGALSGEGTTMLFKAQKPGPSSVHAVVRDTAGAESSADIALNVEAGKTSVKETSEKGSEVQKAGKIGKSKIIVLGSKPETSPSPLKLKVPQGEQTRTLVFTYQHKRVDTGKMEYVFPPPSASSYRIEPSDSGASVTRISNPSKWGKEKLFAVKINKDVKPGRKFTLTADYVGISLPPGSTSRYLDTGEDADEYLRRHVKSATAVIEVIAGKATSDIGNTGYDPTADPNAGDSGSKNIDIAQVDKFGDDFRNITKGSKQSDPKTDKPQTPVQQPDTYTTSVKKTDTSGEQSTYTQPPYPPVSSSDWGKDRTDWTKKWGDKGSQGYGSDTLVDTSSTKRKCDAAQKQAAYQDGVKCGQKARQNNGNMTSECITLSQGHMNRDNQLGWGSCLYSGFDEGYRAGLGTTSGDVAGAVIAELENRSGENVHIFAEGQENFSPQNRLAPGEKRKVNIKVPKAGGFVKFIAGRNGQKLAECKWEYSPGSSNRVPVVKFSDPGNLSCATGLR